MSEKRFDATQARRERARREGNVARSRELAGIGAFAAALGATVLALPLLAAAAGAAVHGSRAAAAALVVLAFAPAAAAALGAAGATLAQGGLHVGAVTVDWAKLAPGAGMRRIFGSEAAVGAARASAAFAVTGAAIVPFVVPLVGAAPALGTPRAVAHAAAAAALQACLAACGTGALFAFADYALARRRWLAGLRMSLDELRRELREHDGDPHTKQRRRQLHRALARGGIERIREASLLIVNPTHVAVALRYAPPAVPVPEIVVRAAGELARTARALAERAGIPVVENAPLARWLYRAGEAGRPIPAETFVAVAETVAALLRAGLLRG